MMLIDSHVNLHAEAFDADREAVIARARQAGVGPMLTICDRIENFPRVISVAETFPDIWASVGAHPHHAKDHLDLTPETLIAMAQHPKVIGIGETGLDQHYGYSSLADQGAVLKTHIAAARALDLPLIVHTREADDATAAILEEESGRGPFRILMHCYTSGEGLARRALALGAYFSLSGILTFKSAHDVRAVASFLPLDRVILETDCPYLAPLPHRGRRNEPAFLVDVHRYFCAWKGIDETDGARLIADNFFRLFSRAQRPERRVP
jgi:TatD DNase family protein